MRTLIATFLFSISLLPHAAVAAFRPTFDAAPWLERLGSGSATERDQAQRWLGLNLTLEDYPVVAARVRGADSETTRRLALALGSEPEHLGLAVLLAGEQDESLKSIGRSAFDDLATRWCPKVTQRPVNVRVVAKLLEDQMPNTFAFGGDEERVELHVDRLARHARFGVPAVVEPGIADRVIRAEQAKGRGLGLLRNLTRENRLTFSGFGDWSEDTPGAGSWILVSEVSGARSRSGTQRLLEWFQRVEGGGSDAAAAARSIANCGWPGALQWLDRRWTERGDLDALEGLLAAAGHGRASQSLLRASDRSVLLQMADRFLEVGENDGGEVDPSQLPSEWQAARRSAESIARALIGAGGIDSDGQEASQAWMAGWGELNESQRWLRFVLFEGQRVGGSRAREFLSEQLALAGGLAVPTRFQALRALAANPTRAEETVLIADQQGLVKWALEQRVDAELSGLLHSMGVRPQAEEMVADPRALIFLLRMACLDRDKEGAAQLCLSLSQSLSSRVAELWGEELDRLRFSCGPRWMSEVGELCRKRASAGPVQDLARLEDALLLSGVQARPADNTEWLAQQTVDGLSVEDYRRLGAWAGTPRGKLERDFLVEAVKSPPKSNIKRTALVDALSHAVRRLFEIQEDQLAGQLTELVWQTSADPLSPMLGELEPAVWPPSEPSLVIDLLGLERLVPGRLGK